MPYDYDDDDFVTYTCPGGIFSIDVPQDWTIRDDSQPGTVLVSFIPPDARLLIRAAVKAAPEDDSDEAWADEVRRFVEATSGQESGFSLDDPEVYEDDSIGVSYAYEIADTTYLGDATIWYDEPFAVMFLAAQPEEDYDDLEDLITDIAESLEIDPDAELPQMG